MSLTTPAELQTKYGNVAPATIGAIQRQLLVLETQGGEKFFGEPALEIADFLRTDKDGRGIINILAADKLMRSPRLYATFLLWMLSELFEHLPEVGDLDKPKLVFFFDEAHLLFDNAPKPLLTAIEQVVRLIRSKGVGVYFITQNPLDVPDSVFGSARQSHRARVARLYAARPESRARGGSNLPAKSGLRHRRSDHAVGRRRSARFHARREGLAQHGGENADRAAGRKGWSRHRRRNARRRFFKARCREIRHLDRPRIRLRDSAKARRSPSANAGAGPASQSPPTAEAPSGGGLLGSLGGIVGGLFTRSNSKRMSTGELVVRSAVQSAARSAGTQITRAVLRGVLGGMSR